MCGITSDQVIEEAAAAKKAENWPRYAACTESLMHEFGLTVEQIRHRVNAIVIDDGQDSATSAIAFARCD